MDYKIFIDTELGDDDFDGSTWNQARKTVPREAIDVLQEHDTLNIDVISSTSLEMPVPKTPLPNTIQINITEHAREG